MMKYQMMTMPSNLSLHHEIRETEDDVSNRGRKGSCLQESSSYGA